MIVIQNCVAVLHLVLLSYFIISNGLKGRKK